MRYPVDLAVSRPARYDRTQLALRLVLMLFMAFVGCTLGWLFIVLYLGLPLLAASLIAGRGGHRYLVEAGPQIVRFLRWVLAFDAYIALLSDRLPTTEDQIETHYAVRFDGLPTVGSALLRLFASLPSAIVLWLVGLVSAALWLFSAIAILTSRAVPRPFFDFQFGVVRWQARLFAYHASLVEEAPPFSFLDEL